MALSFEELNSFIAVVDTGSFTAAGEQLGQTASAVSRSVARLEEKLGASLLTRTTRRLDLTEDGRWFLERARRLIAELAGTEQEMQERQGRLAGKLRINAASPVIQRLLVPLVDDFLDAHPLIELELTSGEQIVDLIEHRTDVAIRIGELRDSTLHARPLGRSRLRLLAAPDYLAARGTPAGIAALSRHRLLGFTQPESLNVWPLRHEEDGLAIAPAVRASSGETLRELVLAGAGIACLADYLVREDLATGRLVTVLDGLTFPSWQRLHAVYYRQSRLAPRIAAFLDFVAPRLETQLDAS